MSLITIPNAIALFFLIGLAIGAIRTKAFNSILSAFNNKDDGYSGRKLTAFGFALLSGYVHYEGFKKSFINQSNIVMVLLIDVCVVLLALALIKVDDILKFKNGSPRKDSEDVK